MTNHGSSTVRENSTSPRNNHRDNTDNLPNLDTQYLKSIKIDVSYFDGHHNSQLF